MKPDRTSLNADGERMKRCKTCKHWGRGDGILFGNCRSPKFVDQSSGFVVFKDEANLIDDDEFHYWDTQGYRAGFETGMSFGCTHHDGPRATGDA